MSIDVELLPGLPVITDWTEVEQEFFKTSNDSFSIGMCREVKEQFKTHPEDYDTPQMLRHVAMMVTALNLHTGRDYTDPVDTQAPSMQRRQGDGMVNPNSTAVAKSILTDNQRRALGNMDRYQNSLIKEIRTLEGKECPELTEFTEEFYALLTTRTKISNLFDSLTKSIDKLKAKRDELKRNAPKPAVVLPSASLTVGLGDICKYEGEFYKVKVSQVGNPYAMRWDGSGWDWDSAKGVIRKLKPEHLATAEDAAQFGHMYHRCVFCSRPLADERSEAVGYGPDCAEKRALPWGV
jgi:hypothetical protein